jgi:putative transposase
VLVFLHVGTRRVFVTPSTRHPNEACVQHQARSFLNHANAEGLGTQIIMHDLDAKFTTSFDQILKSAKVQVMKTAFRAPNTNAFVERFIQTIQQECLDYFIVFGERHMDHLISEMVSYYHEERPHQALDNNLLTLARSAKLKEHRPKTPREKPLEGIPETEIACRSRLGGLLKHYSRKAASVCPFG